MKELFQKEPSLLLSRFTQGVGVKEFLNVELPRVSQRKVDLVLRLADGTILHIEFQSSNHRDMALRMAEYYYLLKRKFRMPVRQIVVFTGAAKLNMANRFDEDGNAFKFELFDVRDLDAAELLASSRYVDNVLAVLAGGVNTMEQRVRQILTKLAGYPVAEREKALAFLGALSGLRKSEKIVEGEIAGMGQIIDWKKNLILRRLHDEGLAEGKTEGLAEGVDVGRRMLSQVLGGAFGPLPKWALDRIESAKPRELETFAANFAGAKSIEQVLGPRSTKR